MTDQEKAESAERPNKTKLRSRQHISRRVYLDSSSPSVRSIIRVVIITLLLLFVRDWVQNILFSVTYLFFLIVLSVFFAYLIDPLVKLIRRPFKQRKIDRFMPRSLAIGIAYLVIFIVVGIGISIVAPRVVDQAKEFATNVPGYVTSVREKTLDINQKFSRLRLPESIQTQIDKAVGEFFDLAANFITSVVLGTYLLNLVTYAPGLVLIPILAFFFLRDVKMFKLSILKIFPSGRWRLRAESVLEDVNTTLAAYTRAQLISCFLVGFICTIGFYLIGIKYALLFGILAGIFEFVPLIGPVTIGTLVTLVAAFSNEPWKALYVAIFLIALRLLQDYVMYPRIVRGGIHLHPLAIILSVVAGEQVAGIPGVFLAIPVVAILTVFYKHAIEHSGHKGLFSAWLEPEKPAAASEVG